MFSARPVLVPALVVLATAWSLGAAAQQVFRIVGPDGRVTFSDRPPPDAKATPAPTVQMPADAGTASAALPFELRNVANRYPVMLYSGSDCEPCSSGRTFLMRRGIPFNERTIGSQDDAAALKRLSGDTRLPLLTIGAQQLRGFSEPEWSQFLDAAGYPRTSQLPPNYRPAAPTPLVAVQAPAVPAAQQSPAGRRPAARQQQPAQEQAAPAPDITGPSNPAGIRF